MSGHIQTILGQGRTAFSFEFFPPKSAEAAGELDRKSVV